METLVVNFANGLNGEAAGFLAAFVSTHAVCDDSEATLALEFGGAGGLPIEVRVLVVFALAAYIAQAGYFNSGFDIHAIDRQFFIIPIGGVDTMSNDKRESRLPAGKNEASLCPGHYRQE